METPRGNAGSAGVFFSAGEDGGTGCRVGTNSLSKRGGRRFGLLGAGEEESLLDGLRGEAEQGWLVAAFAIRERVEARVGRAVSKDYLYDLLLRSRMARYKALRVWDRR